LSILPYIIVVSMCTTYPAYFSNLSDDFVIYIFSFVPYGLGAMLSSYLSKETNFIKSFILYGAAFSASLIVTSIYPSIFAGYVTIFIIAYSHSAIRIQRNNFIMQKIEAEKISRSLGFFEMLFVLGVIVFSLILGVIIEYMGVYMSWLFSGLLMLVVTVYCFSLRHI
jgi:hypothetical protein